MSETAGKWVGIPFTKYEIGLRKKSRIGSRSSTPVRIDEEPPLPVIPDDLIDQTYILVLLVKADRGAQLLKELKECGTLYPEVAETLYINTMKMWFGTESKYTISRLYMEFERDEVLNSYVKENDCVAVECKLSKKYLGCEDGADSYSRNSFFHSICNDYAPCVRFSKRLNFDDSCELEVYPVYVIK